MIVNIDEALSILNSDGIVAVPSETVYGLAGSINSIAAIKRIYQTKKRPLSNPLIVHIAKITDLYLYATYVPHYVPILANKFWPGPLTMVLKKSTRIPNITCGGQNTVALRVPDNQHFLELIKKTGSALAAPSANPYQAVSATHHMHVELLFEQQLPVIAGGYCKEGIESTIVDATSEESITILRPGRISATDIEALTGVPCRYNSINNLTVPGNSEKHYSPNKVTYIYSSKNIKHAIKRHSHQKPVIITRNAIDNTLCTIIVMPDEPTLYAKSLYKTLIEADLGQSELIIIELPPETIEWFAIIDKVKRAGKFIE